jgi:hypothetical protein
VLKYTYDGGANRGLSGYGIPLAFTMNYNYELPFGRNATGVVGHLIGGWELSGIFTAQRGQPFTVTAAAPTALAAGQITNRSPNQVPGRDRENIISGASTGCTFGTAVLPAGRELGTPNLYFDPCAYELPATLELGNVGRNTLIGPSLVRWDFSAAKNFSLTEQWKMQFRSEFFNILNHPNFAGPAANIFTAGGGLAGNAGVISRTLNQNWRQIQFALRLTF